MTYATPDLDGWTLPPFSSLDGIEGAFADDDRPVALWSHYHAIRVVTMLRILRARHAAFEWQRGAVSGDPAAVAAAEANLAATRSELAAWEARRDSLEQARVADAFAPPEWRWE